MIHFALLTDTTMQRLTSNQKRHLRGLAHPLKPVVMLGGKGLTETVLAEIERALNDHELIKVKLNPGDRDQRQQDLQQIQASTNAVAIQRVGNVASLYRRHPEQAKIDLPD